MTDFAVFKRLVLALVFLAGAVMANAQPVEVDVKIVVSVDASGSVDRAELHLQIDGITAAFRDSAVQNAVRNGARGQILAAVLVWSDAAYPKYPTKWHLLHSRQSFEDFALEIAQYKASAFGVPAIGGGGTNIGDGLVYALDMIAENKALAARNVVDISGDGPETVPWVEGAVMMPYARALARRRGVTVNGLAIETDISDLSVWYQEHVITGPGSFVIRARDFQDYRRAILEKLLRELSATPFAAMER